MGCASSKRVDVAADAYRPAPASFSVFDIHAIEEPWLKPVESMDLKQHSQLPDTILAKLNAIEDAPRSWEEVSKALEDLRPKLGQVPAPQLTAKVADAASPVEDSPDQVSTPRKNFNFHTVEELEAKISGRETTGLAKNGSKRVKAVSHGGNGFHQNVAGALKDNVFIKRDKLEREREGKPAGFVKRDPLSDFEDNFPPGGGDSVVLYTTSLGGVRRTYEDCNHLRKLMENHRVAFDERDISLHGGFLNELKELLGEGVSVPRLFVKGRYIGGVDQVVHLNETGRLARILNWARVERGVGRLGCEGCGGARFVPCLDCGGSCKVVVGKMKVRCEECNENGLVQCPACV